MRMVRQRTLKSSFSLEGKGLHTGLQICITFNPAPENHGYKIKRTDIWDQPIIDALAVNVSATDRGTVLFQNGVQVGTVEHALAALYGSEIDNCLIEVNAPEFPILDGSAIKYISKIKEVGVLIQNAEREYITFKKRKIKVVDKTTGSSMMLIPDDSFSIETNISFDSNFLRQQDAQLSDLSDFTKEIASARTFVFVREVEHLLQQGLIKGGDLDNAVIIYDKCISQEDYDRLADMVGLKHKNASLLGYIMNKPLLFQNEPARHKILDVVGDIALIGKFIKGKIIANKPGHKINNLFARAICECMQEDAKQVGVKSFCY